MINHLHLIYPNFLLDLNLLIICNLKTFLKNLFPFRDFCIPFFNEKGMQIFCFCRKTPKQLPQEAKKQGRKDIRGEQNLGKSRKTPNAPENPRSPAREPHISRQGIPVLGTASCLYLQKRKYSPRFDSTSEGFMVE